MKRITISLPESLAGALQREAQRRGISMSQVAREAIQAHVGRGGRRTLPFIGLGRSGYTNTARDWDEILSAEWADAIHNDR